MWRPTTPIPASATSRTSRNLLRDPTFVKGFAAIAERGLSFELWCYAHDLADALTLVREYPETTFVLDHYATPVGLLGPRGKSTGRSRPGTHHPDGPLADDVSALAALPNVVAKHSGLGMPILGGDRSRPITSTSLGSLIDQVAPLIRHVHDVLRGRPHDVGLELPDGQGRS